VHEKLKIKVVGNKRNELLERNEVIFMITHEGSPTPPRVDVRKEIARIFQVDIDKVYIRKIETMTGTTTAVGEAHIYDKPEQAEIIEPEHIIARSSPQKEVKGEVNAKGK